MAITDVVVRKSTEPDEPGSHEQNEAAQKDIDRERRFGRVMLNRHLNNGYQVIDSYDMYDVYRVYVLWKKDPEGVEDVPNWEDTRRIE